ncbi:MAG: hypothetical protein LRY32_02760 [Flavobacterium sp.]|nr:hypothetical protein [Flavobacterium sp.]
MFFTRQLAPFTGYTQQQYNDGELQNRGLEFDIMAHVLKAKNAGDFKLSVGVNGELLTNEVTRMPEGEEWDNGLSVGHSIYDWHMREWAGVDPATGAGLWYMYYDDLNDNGLLDAGDSPIANLSTYTIANPDANPVRTTTSSYQSATQKYVGKSAIPDVRGAFRLNAAYKNFDLTAQVGYSIGGYVYDNGYAQLMDNGDLIGANNWHRDIHNAWKQFGDVTNVPRLSSGVASDVNFNSESTRFLNQS